MRHRVAPLPLAGYDARERRDRVRIIQSAQGESSRKHFKYWPSHYRMAVEKSVEIKGLLIQQNALRYVGFQLPTVSPHGPTGTHLFPEDLTEMFNWK
jgi:hypothetical protein